MAVKPLPVPKVDIEPKAKAATLAPAIIVGPNATQYRLPKGYDNQPSLDYLGTICSTR